MCCIGSSSSIDMYFVVYRIAHAACISKTIQVRLQYVSKISLSCKSEAKNDQNKLSSLGIATRTFINVNDQLSQNLPFDLWLYRNIVQYAQYVLLFPFGFCIQIFASTCVFTLENSVLGTKTKQTIRRCTSSFPIVEKVPLCVFISCFAVGRFLLLFRQQQFSEWQQSCNKRLVVESA